MSSCANTVTAFARNFRDLDLAHTSRVFPGFGISLLKLQGFKPLAASSDHVTSVRARPGRDFDAVCGRYLRQRGRPISGASAFSGVLEGCYFGPWRSIYCKTRIRARQRGACQNHMVLAGPNRVSQGCVIRGLAGSFPKGFWQGYTPAEPFPWTGQSPG